MRLYADVGNVTACAMVRLQKSLNEILPACASAHCPDPLNLCVVCLNVCCLLQYETLGMTSHYKVCNCSGMDQLLHACTSYWCITRGASKSGHWNNAMVLPQVYEASFIEEPKAEPEAG